VAPPGRGDDNGAMAWTESVSPSFRTRYAERDTDDVARMVERLERARERLDGLLGATPAEVTVVVHDTALGLSVAQPLVPLARALATPAARRYVAGWYGGASLHVLSPRLLRARASNVPGSREMLALAPAALYARLAVGALNPSLPPPLTPGTARAVLRWAWLAEGTASVLSGQSTHARPAVARRLREGGRPAFPPGPRDALLLGGTLVDLLAAERGMPAVARLARTRLRGNDAGAVLQEAFGRPAGEVEAGWRARLRAL